MPSGCWRTPASISRSPRATTLPKASNIQAEKGEELTEVYDRLKAADRPVLEEGATTCCYAKSEKSWIADPDGIVWEAFLTNGDATVYGDSPALAALSTNAADGACCAPAVPAQSASCCG